MLSLRKLFIVLILVIFRFTTIAQNNYPPLDMSSFRDSEHHWYDITNKENVVSPAPGQPKFKLNELIGIGDNILLYQKKNGGWPKNYDMLAILTGKQKKVLDHDKNETNTTFDNSTTYTHIACLSTIFAQTGIDKYKSGALHGLNFILTSQFKNGGWPQYYPLKNDYSRYITYNDDVMSGIMILLENILDNKKEYAYIDHELREKLRQSFAGGLQCILKTQIRDNGKLTAWCQQYDEVTLVPAWARKFEPPSICNRESCGVLDVLMHIQDPSKDIIASIQSAISWLNESKITGIKVKTVEAPLTVFKYRVSHTDKVVLPDSTAPPIWARYYELKTHRPLFCNRDSKVVYSLAEVERERRDGYGWYTYEPTSILEKYPAWVKKLKP